MIDLNKYGKYYAAGRYDECKSVYSKKSVDESSAWLLVVLTIVICVCPILGIFIV